MNVHPKVIAVGIICIAILVSIGIYTNRVKIFSGSISDPKIANIVGGNPEQINSAAGDWQKRLAENIAHSTSSVEILTNGSSGGASSEDSSVTAQLSKQFFALYLADQKNGVTIDEAEAQRIAAQALSNISLTSISKQYTVKDVKIIKDSSDAAIDTYASKIASLTKSHFPANSPDPLTLVSAAVKTGAESDAAKLDGSIKAYTSLIRDTLGMSVPLKMSGYHLVYLNTLSNILSDLQYMRKVVSDPVVAYLGFTNYQKDILTLRLTLEKMSTLFPLYMQ